MDLDADAFGSADGLKPWREAGGRCVSCQHLDKRAQCPAALRTPSGAPACRAHVRIDRRAAVHPRVRHRRQLWTCLQRRHGPERKSLCPRQAAQDIGSLPLDGTPRERIVHFKAIDGRRRRCLASPKLSGTRRWRVALAPPTHVLEPRRAAAMRRSRQGTHRACTQGAHASLAGAPLPISLTYSGSSRSSRPKKDKPET